MASAGRIPSMGRGTIPTASPSSVSDGSEHETGPSRGRSGPGAGNEDSRQGLAAVLATPASGGPLGGQALFLGLGPKETAVFQLTKDAGVLHRGPEPIYQALRAFAIPGGHISHSVLLQNVLFGPPAGGALSGDPLFFGSGQFTDRFLVAHRDRLHHKARYST